MLRFLLFAAAAFLPAAVAAGLDCPCDPAQPGTLKLRQCSLCAVAEEQPAEPAVFFVKDKSPMKPNRWLALPRKHLPANHSITGLTRAERTELWTAAIQKAKTLWGADWGVAYNGDEVRTQCHTHVHIGKLLPLRLIETNNFKVVRRIADFPSGNGAGMWIHPVKGGYHVHGPEQRAETVLLR